MKIPDFARLLASVTALSLAVPVLAQNNGSVTDFELPTEQATPRSEVQGPVVEGIAPPRVARPSPTPAPSRPPVVIDTAPVAIDPGESSPSPTAGEAVRSAIDSFGAARSQATATATPAASAAAAETTAEALPPPATGTQPAPPSTPAAAAQPAAPVQTPTVARSGGTAWWLWLLALLAVGAIGILGGWFWRGRSRTAAPLEIETIERPRVPQQAPEPSGPPAELPKVASRKPREREPAPPPAPAVAEDHDDEELAERPLRIALEPARLSVSLLNATLSYRILLTNQGDTPLRDISIDGDMISAHASLSEEEQIAASNSKLENRHLIRTLFPGETKVVSGDFALPLPLIRPIRNGDAALFVPLARLRVVADGEHTEALVQTSVVGQRSTRPGGGLQPFRLDLGPRIYSELVQRAFA